MGRSPLVRVPVRAAKDGGASPRPDALILSCGNQRASYQDLGAFDLTAIEPPLWGAILAGFLRGRGYGVEMVDAGAEGLGTDDAADRAVGIRPRLVVIAVSGTNPSASTMIMGGAGALARAVKRRDPGQKVLLHGLHPSALPERTLLEEGADFVCQGEGFFTLPSLLDALRAGVDGFDAPGLWRLQGGRAVGGRRPSLLKDLDELPLPAWDLLPMEKYRAHNWHCFGDMGSRQPYGVLHTNLGCPYTCVFCCINALFGRPGIRYRSPSRVVDEIDLLVETFGVRNIKIADELFAIKEDRVIDICDRIIERGHDLNMWAYARVNTVTDAMLRRMKRAGVNWVAFGFESASRRVLEGANKGYPVARALEAVRMARDNGLHIVANFIFGLPGDDYDSMQETLDLAMRINAEWLNAYPAMPYPGSELYTRAVEGGWPLPETWDGYSPYSYECRPLPTGRLTAGQVVSFRDYAFHAYFENPRYLDRIHSLFGAETVSHIRKMAGHRLKRRFTQFGEGS